MGKICGLKYFYGGRWIWASQDKCEAGWESFGTVKAIKGTAARIAILYECEKFGCDVYFDLIYHMLGDRGKTYGPFTIPLGQGLAEIILEPVNVSGWISVYAWERVGFGRREVKDKMWFTLEVVEMAPKPVTVGDPWIVPEYPTAEDEVTIYQKVRNDGNVAGNIEVKFYLDGDYVGSRYVMLTPGETRTVSKSVGKVGAGRHNSCVQVVV